MREGRSDFQSRQLELRAHGESLLRPRRTENWENIPPYGHVPVIDETVPAGVVFCASRLFISTQYNANNLTHPHSRSLSHTIHTHSDGYAHTDNGSGSGHVPCPHCLLPHTHNTIHTCTVCMHLYAPKPPTSTFLLTANSPILPLHSSFVNPGRAKIVFSEMSSLFIAHRHLESGTQFRMFRSVQGAGPCTPRRTLRRTYAG
eukprot:scaffold13849_cov136-Isochrysis_galbana.AAC.1